MTQNNVESLILRIADGTQSASRIRNIIKSICGTKPTYHLVTEVTEAANIPTPPRQLTGDKLQDEYPDRWSILLEALTFWVRVRRYWGDREAFTVKEVIAKTTQMGWRSLYPQFGLYTVASIYDRHPLSYGIQEDAEPLELERLYPWNLHRQLYLEAYDIEFERNSEWQTGSDYPLVTPEWESKKREENKQKAIAMCDRKFPTETEIIQFFGEFWCKVRENRGDRYFDNLLFEVVGHPNSPLNHVPYYRATEKNFRLFLHNLEWFTKRSHYHVDEHSVGCDSMMPLRDPALEGALLKYGWAKIETMCACGILAA